jgi:hypothetical protein
MIERIVSQIITELGPTGLLVIGLYFALAVPLNKIAKAIEQVNKDNIPTKEVITSCTEKIVEAIHGQN